jgi:Fe2+ transport system protein FeoA
MHCQLCGFFFIESNLSCRASCGLTKHCSIICCPNCGYQVVDESKSGIATVLREAWDHFSGRIGSRMTLRLNQMHPGQSGTVLSIVSSSVSRLERLSMLGITPGARVTLKQRRPAIVLRVGFTDFSVENQVAQEILIEAD